MNKIAFLFLVVLVITFACQERGDHVTESEKKSLVDSARVTVQKVFEASNNLRFSEGLNYYSGDEDAYYTNNGVVLSLADLKESYSQIGTAVEALENSIEKWNSAVLSKNTVAFTLPISLRIKLRGIPEYRGQLIWTGIVQKRDGRWVIVQSHESWLNCLEVATALSGEGLDAE